MCHQQKGPRILYQPLKNLPSDWNVWPPGWTTPPAPFGRSRGEGMTKVKEVTTSSSRDRFDHPNGGHGKPLTERVTEKNTHQRSFPRSWEGLYQWWNWRISTYFRSNQWRSKVQRWTCNKKHLGKYGELMIGGIFFGPADAPEKKCFRKDECLNSLENFTLSNPWLLETMEFFLCISFIKWHSWSIMMSPNWQRSGFALGPEVEWFLEPSKWVNHTLLNSYRVKSV